MPVTNSLPLNKFRLITANLNSGDNTIYQENLDVSSIILSCQITNISGTTQTATIQIQKSGTTGNNITLFKNGVIPPNESFNPIGGKVVLEKNDALIINTNQTGALDVVLSVLENAIN